MLDLVATSLSSSSSSSRDAKAVVCGTLLVDSKGLAVVGADCGPVEKR